jgi:hypothetical protein
MFKTLFTVSLCLSLANVALARDVTDPYDAFRSENEKSEFEFDDSGKQWKEQNVSIKPADLDKLKKITIDHGPIGVDIYLDGSSIRSDEQDRVVRYWLVLKNSKRITSMLYEGIRCATSEYRTYASASPNKPDEVRNIGNSSWRQIRGVNVRDYHSELASGYLCAGSSPRTVTAIHASLNNSYDFHNPYSEHTDL